MLVTRVERLEAVAPAEEGRFGVLAFDVELTVTGDPDPKTGMVVNLADVKRDLRTGVIERLAGRVLDGKSELPRARTAEELGAGIWKLLKGRVAGRPLHRLRLVGNPSPIVECYGGQEEDMDVTRIYEFSASHRLHDPSLSEKENRRLFGKCTNPKGHGHNYVIEVTVRGVPSERGEVVSAREFDQIVTERILERWDHKNLNEDVPEFRELNPTAEEIARIAWQRVVEPLGRAGTEGASLHRIKVRETDRNHVEYFGE